MSTDDLKRLSRDQVEAYRRDGFLSPIDALSVAEARALRDRLEAFEGTLPPGPVDRKDRRKLHVRLACMRDLVDDARILDAVEDLIGPDILVFNSTFFIKEAQTDAITAWHQDATYFGLEPYEHVSAWLAFSEASEESGCMQFIRGSHHWGQLAHVSQAEANSINNASQTISVPFDATGTAFTPLRPGQFSLHHTLTIHQSAPNHSRDRRIGLGISYIPTRVRHKGSYRIGATVVRGVDRYGHFELEPDPRLLSPEEAEVAHARAYRSYREGYEEQMAWHVSAYAPSDTAPRAEGHGRR